MSYGRCWVREMQIFETEAVPCHCVENNVVVLGVMDPHCSRKEAAANYTERYAEEDRRTKEAAR